jgi:hypothetical protein
MSSSPTPTADLTPSWTRTALPDGTIRYHFRPGLFPWHRSTLWCYVLLFLGLCFQVVLMGGVLAISIFLIVALPIVLPIGVWTWARANGSIEVSPRGLRLRTVFGLFRADPQIPLTSLDRLVICGQDHDFEDLPVGPAKTLIAVDDSGRRRELAAGDFSPGVLQSFGEELARECERLRGENAGAIFVEPEWIDPRWMANLP